MKVLQAKKRIEDAEKKAPPMKDEIDLSVFTVEELEQLQALMTVYQERTSNFPIRFV